jgi:hypothetical protein
MKVGIILAGLFVGILAIGCRQRGKHVNAWLNDNETPECYSYVEGLKADSLFHYACPVLPNTKEYVYLLNGECSFCIAKALDCYSAFLQMGQNIPFYFLSREEDADIFKYSFKQKYNTNPSVYFIPEDISIPDGLFLVVNNQIEAYVPWS